MKKALRIITAFALLVSLLVPTALAANINEGILVSTSTTQLADGSYIVEELTRLPSTTRSTTSGSKTKTYYNSDDESIFSVTVTGTFTYNGSSATANSSSCAVAILDSSASYVSKSAYTSGNTAYGTGTVKYNNRNVTLSPSLSCDKNGNLS